MSIYFINSVSYKLFYFTFLINSTIRHCSLIVCHFPNLSLQEVNTHRGHQVSLNQFRNLDSWCLVSELDFDNLPHDQTASPADIRSDAGVMWSCSLAVYCSCWMIYTAATEILVQRVSSLAQLHYKFSFRFTWGLVSSISANEGKHLPHLQWSEMTQRKRELCRLCVCRQPQTTSLWLSFACARFAVSSWFERQQVGFDFQLDVLNISCTVSVI